MPIEGQRVVEVVRECGADPPRPLERPPHAEKRADSAPAPDGKGSDKPQRRFILDGLVR